MPYIPNRNTYIRSIWICLKPIKKKKLNKKHEKNKHLTIIADLWFVVPYSDASGTG